MGCERLEDVFVDRGIFDQCLREHDGRRVLPFLRVGGDAGNEGEQETKMAHRGYYSGMTYR